MSNKLPPQEDNAELRAFLNQALKDIQHSDPSIDFPNYMAEIGQIPSSGADVALVEGFIQSVLGRLRIPHMYNGEITSTDYFRHLHQTADALATDKEVDIELYIAGGVVRTMLANMYKFVHERKAQQGDYCPDIVANAVAEEVKYSKDVKDKMYDVQKQMLQKHKMLHSTEFHLKQAALGEKDSLLAPFVLGVGSDLDIYYEVLPKGKELTAKEKQAGEDIARSLVDYMNKVENESGFREQTGSFKHSILPNADVKEYHSQVNRSLAQGGSLLDSLAYKIESKSNFEPSNQQADSRMRLPDAHPNILQDFFAGFYEYVSPPGEEFQGKISQKQAIRGLRPLLEMPFLDIKDQTVIVQELQQVLEDISSGKTLDERAQQQFDKMVRNANFQLGNNRPYQSEDNSPLSLGLKIADAAFLQGDKSNEKVRFLLPSFLQSMPIESSEDEVERRGLHHDSLGQFLLSKEAFIQEHTDNGLLYHGTNAEAGLCVLRGGFIVSTKKQGAAVYGPGVYTTSDKSTAGSYAGEGIVIPMNLSQENAKTLDWQGMSGELKKKLEQEAKDKGFEHVFELLRDRNEYAVDIIIDTHVIIQNQKAINIKQSLESILEMLSGGIVHNFEKMIQEESADAMPSYFTALNYYKKYRELFAQLGVDVSQSIEAEAYFDKHHREGLEKYIGEEISIGEEQGHNILTFAARKGYDNIIEMIVKKKPELINYLVTGDYWGGEHNALTYAAGKNNIHLVKEILKVAPESANYVIKGSAYYDGHNALTFAIYKGHTELAKMILDKAPECANYVVKGSRHEDGYNALTFAVHKGETELVRMILDKAPDSANHVITTYGLTKGHNALTCAIIEGNTELASLILDKAPDSANHVITRSEYYGGHTGLTIAISKGDIGVAKMILELSPDSINHVITGGKYDHGYNSLTLAISRGDIGVAKMILELSPDSINHVITGSKYDGGHNALTLAISRGDIGMAKMILELSPDSINHIITVKNGKSYNAWTLAISLAKFDLAQSISELAPQLVEKSKNTKEAYNDAIRRYGLDIDRMQQCVENGADINFENKYGMTLLEKEITNTNKDKDAEKIGKLLKMGADAAHQSKHCSTLILAMNAGFDIQTLKLLVQHGADINATTSENVSCLELAEKSNNSEMIAWIKEEMAASNKKENLKEVSHNQTGRKTMIHLGKRDKDKTVAAESSKVEPKNENDENTENPSRKPSSKKSG